MVTWENYDEYMMLEADGELTHEEQQSLYRFIAANPALSNELELYRKARLTYDKHEVYIGKKALLKGFSGGLLMNLRSWQKYGLAACVAVLLCTGLYKYSREVKHAEQQLATPSRPESPRMPIAGANGQAEPVTHGRAVAASCTPSKRKARTDHGLVAKTHTIAAPKQPSGFSRTDGRDMPSVSLASPIVIGGGRARVHSVELMGIPFSISAVDSDPARQRLWDKLPIDELKKEKLENLAAEVTQAIQSIGKARRETEEKNVTVRLEKRKLLIFF